MDRARELPLEELLTRMRNINEYNRVAIESMSKGPNKPNV